MPDGPLSANVLQRYADPAYLSRSAPAQKEDGPNWMHRIGLPVSVAGDVADTVSTIQALHRGGTSEANPLFGKQPSPAKLIALTAAMKVPIDVLLDRMHDKSAPG